MPQDPIWWRPDGAYVRNDTVRRVSGDHTVNAVGCYAYPAGYKGLLAGADVMVELIPEPDNPHDPLAVSLEVDQRRVGYLSRIVASTWHPVVAQFNATGERVEAPGRVVDLLYDQVDTDQTLGIVVSLPWPSDILMWRATADLGTELGAPWTKVAIHRDQFLDTHVRLVADGQEVVHPVILTPGVDGSYKRGPQPCLDVWWGDDLVAVVPSRPGPGPGNYDALVHLLDDPRLITVVYVRSMGAGDRMVQLWALLPKPS